MRMMILMAVRARLLSREAGLERWLVGGRGASWPRRVPVWLRKPNGQKQIIRREAYMCISYTLYVTREPSEGNGDSEKRVGSSVGSLQDEGGLGGRRAAGEVEEPQPARLFGLFPESLFFGGKGGLSPRCRDTAPRRRWTYYLGKRRPRVRMTSYCLHF